MALESQNEATVESNTVLFENEKKSRVGSFPFKSVLVGLLQCLLSGFFL